MDWAIVQSKKSLMDILKEKPDPSKVCFVEGSDILKSRIIPDKYTLFLYRTILVPGATQLNKFYDNSVSYDDYAKAIVEYYNKSNRLVFINELVYFATQYDMDVIVYCSEDEKDFGFLEIFADMMERLYGINIISGKKYRKGNHSNHLKDLKKIFSYSEKIREDIFKRFDAMNIRLPVHMLRRFTEKELKEMPKKIRKMILHDIELYNSGGV